MPNKPCILIFATSLSPTSKSYILAKAAQQQLESQGVSAKLIDLRDYELPESGRAGAFDHPNVKALCEDVGNASHILFACAIYNYDVSAAAKNLLELLTGDEIIGKTVGFLCAAGGHNSYMSVMPFANSLMLDFRCWIVPRFVYAVKNDFADNRIVNEDIEQRITLLIEEMLTGSNS